MSTATVRADLAAACATIVGLHGAPYRTDNLANLPLAVVTPGEWDPRFVMGEGKAVRDYIVSVYAGRTAEVAAQKLLDTYCELSGSTSVVAAIQGYSSLQGGATADYATVTSISDLQVETIGLVDYLLIRWTVEVCA